MEDSFKEYKVGTTEKVIKRIVTLLEDKRNWPTSIEDLKIYKTLESQRNDLIQVEETIWRQKNIVVWIKQGDYNTKFFHGKTSQRKKMNSIKKLKDDNGCWWNGDVHCERILVDYFLIFLLLLILSRFGKCVTLFKGSLA